jgi:uncharacterized coiled-coil DUF342 family protein
MLDLYVRNARVITEAFDVIKQGSGITNIDEIVTTFIKAEEQNYSLFNYVNELDQECDALEESNAKIDNETARYNTMSRLNKTELKEKISTMKDESDNLRDQIQRGQAECDDVIDEFGEMQGLVEEMVNTFKAARFTARVAESMQYDEHTQFNENNVTIYLAELEEYISSLITYSAFQNGDP